MAEDQIPDWAQDTTPPPAQPEPPPPPAEATEQVPDWAKDQTPEWAREPYPGHFPGTIEALQQGAQHMLSRTKQTITAFSSVAPTPEPETSRAAEPLAWGDIAEPFGKLAPKLAYRVTDSSLGIAGGIVGGIAGGATPIPGGALMGGALGAAVGAGFETLGPIFADELHKNPNDPEGAWTRAKESAAISGVFSGASWAAFPLKMLPSVIEGPVKNAMFKAFGISEQTAAGVTHLGTQAFGVQPGISVAQQAVQNIREDRPIGEGAGQAYGEGAAMMIAAGLGHAAITGRIGEAPKPLTPEQRQAIIQSRSEEIERIKVQMKDPNISPNEVGDLHDKMRTLQVQNNVDQIRLDGPGKIKELNERADALEQQISDGTIEPKEPAPKREDFASEPEFMEALWGHQQARYQAFDTARLEVAQLRKQAVEENLISKMPFSSPSHGKFFMSFVRNVAPEMYSDLARRMDSIFGAFKSGTQRQMDQLMNKTEYGELSRYPWNKVSEDDRFAFLRSFESEGRLPKDLSDKYPWMERQAANLRDILDQAYKVEEAHGSNAVFREDYVPHLYTDQAASRNFFQNPDRLQNLGPRPDFQKGRYYETIDDALISGLELRTTNPVDLVTQRLMAGIDMVKRVELLQELYENGAAVPHPRAPYHIAYPQRGELNPWRLINGPTGVTRMPDGAIDPGKQWFLSPDVQSLWDNAVSPKGLYHDEGLAGGVFRKWMNLKNMWVPIKLGMSLFHPVHVLHISLSNNVSRALNETFGKGEQGLYRRAISIPEALLQTVTDTVLAMPLLGRKYTGIDLPMRGKDLRDSWNKPENEQTPWDKQQNKIMEESGTVPQKSRQMAYQAKRSFWDAWGKSEYLKALGPGVRLGMEKATGWLFDEWIPNLKTAAVAREAESLFRRRPDLLEDDNNRQVAMRAIGKQVDNRFGEMFYGSLFWNRTMKDAAIGSFLSLGWNLGFMREFVGGALEPAARRLMSAPTPTQALIRQVTSKTTNMAVYTLTAAIINATITKLVGGEDPEGMDYIFPRIGGLNPDGSPRRISNPFYTREIPMAAKNIEEQQGVISGLTQMMYHKMMFAPIQEWLQNKDYFGYQIHDPAAPGWQQVKQMVSHLLGEQVNPMAISGAQRNMQLSGKQASFGDVMKALVVHPDSEAWLPVLGFGPAPSYASKDALENRITSLFQREVAPSEKPFSMAEDAQKRITARNMYLNAMNKFNEAKKAGDTQAMEEATKDRQAWGKTMADLGVKPGAIKRLVPGTGIQTMFQRLQPPTQVQLLKDMDKDDFKKYWPKASKNARRDSDVRDLWRKYYNIP